MRIFTRTYYSIVASTLLLLAGVVFGRELTFWLWGYDQALITSATADAFRAYRETAFPRLALFWVCFGLDSALILLSVAALALRRRGQLAMHVAIPVSIMIGAVLLFLLLVAVNLAPPPVILG